MIEQVDSNQAIPVIILDCDYRSQEGIIQTFGRKKIPIIAVSSKADCVAFKSRYISQRIISPNISDGIEEYIDFLLKLPVRGVIIYSNDVNALVIAKYQNILKDSGFLLNVPDFSIMNTAFDKWQCYELAQKLHIPVAKTKLVSSLEEVELCWDDFVKPIILKGTRLAGGLYQKLYSVGEVRKNWNIMQSLIHSLDYRNRESNIILQEWLDYKMTDIWCCETIYNQKSEPMGFFTINKIRTSFNENGSFGSRLYAGEHIMKEQLVDLSHKILSHVNWKGFAHIDWVYVPKEDKFYLTEVNPRLPGFSYYPSEAGYDMAYYYYADLAGDIFEVPGKFPKSVYFEAFRYPGDITDGLFNILKGYLSLPSFLKSYCKLMKPKIVRVIDPIKLDDPLFTLWSQIDNLARFLKKVTKFIIKSSKKNI